MSNNYNINENYYEIYTDGASRGNPGISGIGFLIKKNNKIIYKDGFIIGTSTNNFSEYFALIVAIVYFKENINLNEKFNLIIFSDSLLLIKQLKKEYKVKNFILKKCFNFLYDNIKNMDIKFEHILREKNIEADLLANKGIDEKKILPENFNNLFIELYK